MEGAIRKRFDILDGLRSGHLERQRVCASLTIPSLLPPNGYTENQQLPTPWQAHGARGVNNLASKLLLTLLPANGNFFRLTPAPKIEDEIRSRRAQGEDVDQGELEAMLGVVERKISKAIEQQHIRVAVFRALKLLIVTGNAILFLQKDGGAKVYRLDQFVVQRDKSGNVVEFITREEVSPHTLEDDMIGRLGITPEDREQDVTIFTRVKRDQSEWSTSQEINGIPIDEATGSYPLESMPWIILRWSDSDGGHYGRGLADEVYGDLQSLENLTKTVVEGSAAMAKMLFLVNPNGVTSYRDLAETPNTGFAPGKLDDVGCLQANKHADFQAAHATRQELLERLAHAFLMNSSVQRQAERVNYCSPL